MSQIGAATSTRVKNMVHVVGFVVLLGAVGTHIRNPNSKNWVQ
jgi:hypothetical protein